MINGHDQQENDGTVSAVGTQNLTDPTQRLEETIMCVKLGHYLH